MLPESVLSRAAAEMMDYHGSGQSVMEMSHRSKVFEEIIADSIRRELKKRGAESVQVGAFSAR